MPEELQQRLINWGYAICDAALRRYFDPSLPAPGGFPYPVDPLGPALAAPTILRRTAK